MHPLIDEATVMWIPNFEPFQLLGTIHGIGTDFGTFAMATASLLMVV